VTTSRTVSTAEVGPGRWRIVISLLASVQLHVLLWGPAPARSPPARLSTAALAELEIPIELDPSTDPTPNGSARAPPRAMRGSGHSDDPHTPASASRALTSSDHAPQTADDAIVQGPSLDWLYAIVAARGHGDGQGAGGGRGAEAAGGSPARLTSSDWRSCPARVEHAPAVAHVVVNVDTRGRPLRAQVVDADSGTSAAAVECAMRAAYIPAHDAQGRPVRGNTRPFRIEFLEGAARAR